MSAVGLTTIHQIFVKQGWSARIIKNQMVVTYLKVSIGYSSYGIRVECDVLKHWATVRGIITRRTTVATRSAVALHIASLNERCYTARFFLDKNTVLLQSEVALLNWSEPQFLNALASVAHYGKSFGEAIDLLAGSATLANHYVTAFNARARLSEPRSNEPLEEYLDSEANAIE